MEMQTTLVRVLPLVGKYPDVSEMPPTLVWVPLSVECRQHALGVSPMFVRVLPLVGSDLPVLEVLPMVVRVRSSKRELTVRPAGLVAVMVPNMG